MTKPAVETVGRPQFRDVLQNHRLHLLHAGHSVRAGTRGRKNKDVVEKITCFNFTDLFELGVTLPLWDFIQKTFDVQSHVWS